MPGWLGIRLQEKQPAGTAQAESEGTGPTSDDDQNRQKTAEQVELVNRENSGETLEKIRRAQDRNHFLFKSSLRTHYSILAALILFIDFVFCASVFICPGVVCRALANRLLLQNLS